MGRRKAYYLLQLGQRLKGLRLPEKRLSAIGWTKLQVISDHLTPQNAEELLAEAEECTTQELRVLMGGGSKAKRRCVLLYFSPRQYRQLEEAILTNGGKRRGRGLVGKETAILRMVRRHGKSVSAKD
jgi:hypothetical protein